MTILGQDDEICVVVRLVAKTPGRDDEHEPGEHACGNLIDGVWLILGEYRGDGDRAPHEPLHVRHNDLEGSSDRSAAN